MDSYWEDRLQWFADRSLAGKFPRGEITAATTYAREIILLRQVVLRLEGATVAHMTDTNPSNPSILRWVDVVPAAKMPNRPDLSRYDELFEDLRNHPNQWALVGDGKTGVLNASTSYLRQKGFKVRTRTIEGDERDTKGRKLIAVYARYVSE